MRFCTYRKDGGPESRVSGFFLVEIKAAFTIVLLRFDDGSRDAYHSHAFNAVSWVLGGKLVTYESSWRPIVTRRERIHKVVSDGRTWVLSFRGPWVDRWREYQPASRLFITLTHGRSTVPA